MSGILSEPPMDPRWKPPSAGAQPRREKVDAAYAVLFSTLYEIATEDLFAPDPAAAQRSVRKAREALIEVARLA